MQPGESYQIINIKVYRVFALYQIMRFFSSEPP